MNNIIASIRNTQGFLYAKPMAIAPKVSFTCCENVATVSILESGSLAEAYYDSMPLSELENMLLDGPDPIVLASWNLSEDDWLVQVNVAMEAIRQD